MVAGRPFAEDAPLQDAAVTKEGGQHTRAGVDVYIGVALASLANLLNQADRIVMAIAIIPMSAELGWGMMEKGCILSTFGIGYISVQILAGWLSSKLPAFGVLTVAVLAWSSCTLLTPAAARCGIRTLCACRVCLGVAEGFGLPAAFQYLGLYVPPELRSRSSALILGAGSAGQLLVFLVCPQLPHWSWMFRSFGGAGMAWCVLSAGWAVQGAALARHRRGDTFCTFEDVVTGEGTDPEESGDTSAGEEEGDEEDDVARSKLEWKGQKEAPGHGEDSESGTGDVGESSVGQEGRSIWHLLTSRALLGICLAHFGQNWTFYLMQAWLPTYLHQVLGMPMEGLSITAVPFLVHWLASLTAGHLADHALKQKWCSVLAIRRVATAVGFLGVVGGNLLLIFLRSPHAAVVTMSFAYALGAAGTCGFSANHADISKRHAGLTFGISNTLATVPAIAAGPLTAALVAAYGDSWWAVFALAAAIGTVSCGSYLALAQAHRIL